MKEKAASRINKMGRIGAIVMRIVEILQILAIMVCVAMLLMVGYVPGNYLESKITEQVEVTVNDPEHAMLERSGSLEKIWPIQMWNVKLDQREETEEGYRLWGERVRYQESFGNYMLMMGIGVGYMLFMLIITIYAGRLCRAFATCQSPFEENVIQSMKRLAYAMIPWSLAASLTDISAWQFVYTGKLNFAVSFDMLLVLAAVYALIFIFRYGAMLQQESDETI